MLLTFWFIIACLELIPLYAATNEMSAGKFARFTDPNNFVAQILLMHFWMLARSLERHVLGEGRVFAIRDETAREWVKNAARRLPESYKQYALWPLGMATCYG